MTAPTQTFCSWLRPAPLVLGALLLLHGCKSAQKLDEQPANPALESHVLESVPNDIEERTFFDFEGKVHLIGYKLEPKGVVGPGGRLKLTLYWQSVSPLSPGFKLFTHVID